MTLVLELLRLGRRQRPVMDGVVVGGLVVVVVVVFGNLADRVGDEVASVGREEAGGVAGGPLLLGGGGLLRERGRMLTIGVLALPVDVWGRQLVYVRRTASSGSRAQRGRVSGPGVTCGGGGAVVCRGLVMMLLLLLEGDVLRLRLGVLVVVVVVLSSFTTTRCLGAAVQVLVRRWGWGYRAAATDGMAVAVGGCTRSTAVAVISSTRRRRRRPAENDALDYLAGRPPLV
jgi:hypothetical protein